MRSTVDYTDNGTMEAIKLHLKREFGGFIQCGSGCPVFAPPIGKPFKVLEPLQTQPSFTSREHLKSHGLTRQGCVPRGIYAGVNERGIFQGTSTHSIGVEGASKHSTHHVSIRLVDANIDWRGIKAIATSMMIAQKSKANPKK